MPTIPKRHILAKFRNTGAKFRGNTVRPTLCGIMLSLPLENDRVADLAQRDASSTCRSCLASLLTVRLRCDRSGGFVAQVDDPARTNRPGIVPVGVVGSGSEQDRPGLVGVPIAGDVVDRPQDVVEQLFGSLAIPAWFHTTRFTHA